MDETVKILKFSKSDKIVLVTLFSVLILAMWSLPLYSSKIENVLNFDEDQLEKEFNLYYRILFTIIFCVLIFTIIKNKGEVTRPKSSGMKYVNRWMGWDRRYFSINLKIGAVLVVLFGIASIIFNKAPLWMNLMIIALGPLLWYLSNRANERAQEFFEAGKK